MNIIWIMSDQHAGFASGCYGNPVVQTPNIDRLASEGLRFVNAYTPSPVCVPARFAALSGQYPHTSGCRGNNTPLPVGVRSAAHYFAAAGYVTAFIGKMHPVEPQTHGFDFLVDMGHYFDYLGPKTEIFARGMDAARNTGCGVPWTDSWYRPHPWQAPPAKPVMPKVVDRIAEVLPEADHFEAFVARNCEAFLTRHGKRPFFLFASMLKPHYPLASPREYHDMYDPAGMPLPETMGDTLCQEGVFENVRAKEIDNAEGLERARMSVADYYASVSYMDECVGRILHTVDRLGLRENTLVVYTSDHGEMLFYHGLIGKSVYFEGSANVPLIGRCPGKIRPGGTSEALTDLTDLLPTSLALAGVKSGDAHLDGVDLSPIFSEEASSVRKACYSELGLTSMIRTERWKLADYAKGVKHLFDLADDPGERHNRYEELCGTDVVKALETELALWKNGRPAAKGGDR